jgi:hypothetical protein
VTDQPAEDTEQDTQTDFAVTLLALNRGLTHKDLTEKLAELVTAVTKVKKSGKLQLTITVKPQPAVDGALFVAADIKASIPRFDPKASIFYATETGGLVRNNPDQPSLFREITTSTKENK